jgi:excisionase family DNA binding protein
MSISQAPVQRRAFSPREVAAQLGRDRASVYRWIKSKELRTISVSGRLMIADREIERFLSSVSGEKVKTRKRSKAKRQEVGA